jgi:hypothetical protein
MPNTWTPATSPARQAFSGTRDCGSGAVETAAGGTAPWMPTPCCRCGGQWSSCTPTALRGPSTFVTNPIIEVDDAAGTATCRSYYTVLQHTDDLPLQVIVTGRYDDRFERVDGRWRFAYRDYSLIDATGDVSHHLSRQI